MTEKAIFHSLGWLLAGLLAGSIQMGALWINVQLLMRPEKRPLAVALIIGRFLLLVVVIYLAARNGTASFFLASFGVLVTRPLILRFMKTRMDPGLQIGEEGPLR